MGSPSVDRHDLRAVGRYVLTTIQEKDLSGLAQQIAYNVLFAIGPLLIVITALAGWVTQLVNADEPNPAAPVLEWMQRALPAEAAAFLREPVNNALNTTPAYLLSFGAIATLWAARNALRAVIKGLNVAYGVDPDERSWFRKTAISLALTLGLAALLALSSLIFVLGTRLGDDLADAVGLAEAWATLSAWARWPIIFGIVVVAIALLHRFGTNIQAPLTWFLPGAAFTALGMLLATLALSTYFARSGGFAEGYGAFGAVLAFVFWLYVMGLVILAGGVINKAIQTEIPAARRDMPSPTRAARQG